ncbi:MAG: histidinol-phosphate transaminase [Syntrophobacterales bacterium]|nr:MAG: histidinol-phosphate transaminase [Syntrophobacterales bacterium]
MKDVTKLARKGILTLKPYVPGKPIEEVQRELGLKDVTKLASNENSNGPSPEAIRAIEAELDTIFRYPDPSCTLLRNAVAKKLGVGQEMITLANGCDNIIYMIGAAFINQGDEVIMAEPTFPVYESVTRIMGGRAVPVKLKHHTHDLDGMAERIGPKTKLVFLCNPNNPTGTIVPKAALNRFLAGLTDDVILALDEAYFDYVSEKDYPDGISLLRDDLNLIALRTFSKIYGLAGLRIGYAVAHGDLIGLMERVREPFPVNRVAQAAALAALADEKHVERVLRQHEEGRAFLYRQFQRLKVDYVPTQANFIFVNFKRDSQEIYHALLKEGVIIRPGTIWDYPTSARITIGTMDENRRLIEKLEGFLRRR